MLVAVVAGPSEQWPLPWYLRGFEHVGYWEQPPDDADAPVVIVSAELESAVATRLRQRYLPRTVAGRPTTSKPTDQRGSE